MTMRWLGLTAALVGAGALHLPGAHPSDFAAGEAVPLKVNKLWSAKTQLTYDFYSLPLCTPAAGIVREAENIGQVLVGDRLTNSDYQLVLGSDTRCNVLCTKEYNQEELDEFTERIASEYTVGWVVDGLPAAVRMYEEGAPERVHLERGFPLGFQAQPPGAAGKRSYIFNHIQFIIGYHQEHDDHPEAGPLGAGEAPADDIDHSKDVDPSNAEAAKAAGVKYRIVGFEVEPYTVKHKKTSAESASWAGNLETCSASRFVTRDDEPQLIDAAADVGTVVYTYDVIWERSDVPWSQRWDIFLMSGDDDDIHWFSIINSLMIVLFLTGMIAMILVRNLYRDIARYNSEEAAQASEEAAEETGWKLVHGDVFRPPAGFFGPMFLSVFVGSGMQLLAMCAAALLFAVLGFLSPANQGSLLTGFIVLFMCMGSFAGYTSARIYKMFRGKAWKRNTTLTAFAFPGTIYSVAFVLNLFVWAKRSSLAIPFTTMLILFALWFGISVPLVTLGSYFGFKAEEVKHPVRINNIPRSIPPQPWYLHPIPSILVGGILPFGAVFIELFFIMSSIWLAQLYFFFGFLYLVLFILSLTCAEISIVMCYFQLCSEDYNWWWRSFLTAGTSALYLFLYSIVYFATKLEITSPISILLYFGYMATASWGFFLLTGSIGFISTLAFVQRIYSAIKVD